MINRRNLVLGGVLSPFLGLSVSGEEQPRRKVDTALVLMTDISLSVSHDNYKIQHMGMAEAFRSKTFETNLVGTTLAVNYCQWARNQYSFGWHILKEKADYYKFADLLENPPRLNNTLDGSTNIAGCLQFARNVLLTCPYDSDKKVVDVSGDGIETAQIGVSEIPEILMDYTSSDRGRFNRSGAVVMPERDKLLETFPNEISINGIVIENEQNFSVREFYENFVIGGPLSFVLEAKNYKEFAEVFIRKLVLETS